MCIHSSGGNLIWSIDEFERTINWDDDNQNSRSPSLLPTFGLSFTHFCCFLLDHSVFGTLWKANCSHWRIWKWFLGFNYLNNDSMLLWAPDDCLFAIANSLLLPYPVWSTLNWIANSVQIKLVCCCLLCWEDLFDKFNLTYKGVHNVCVEQQIWAKISKSDSSFHFEHIEE